MTIINEQNISRLLAARQDEKRYTDHLNYVTEQLSSINKCLFKTYDALLLEYHTRNARGAVDNLHHTNPETIFDKKLLEYIDSYRNDNIRDLTVGARNLIMDAIVMYIKSPHVNVTSFGRLEYNLSFEDYNKLISFKKAEERREKDAEIAAKNEKERLKLISHTKIKIAIYGGLALGAIVGSWLALT